MPAAFTTGTAMGKANSLTPGGKDKGGKDSKHKSGKGKDKDKDKNKKQQPGMDSVLSAADAMEEAAKDAEHNKILFAKLYNSTTPLAMFIRHNCLATGK
jgi:hypothetical protein